MAKTRSFPEQQGNSWYFGVRPRTREEVVLRRSGYRFLILHFSLGTQPEDGYPSTASSVTELSAARPATADVKTYRETPNTYSKLPVCSYLCIYCIHLTVSSDAFSWFGCVFFVFPFVLLHGTGHKRDCVQGLREKKGHVNEFLTPVAASHGTGRTVRHRCFFVCFVFFIFHVVLLMFSSLSMLFLFQYYVPLFFSFLLLLF